MNKSISQAAARRTGIAALCFALVAVSGCSSMSEREQGTAKGAGIGAVAGAVIGSATGGNAGRSAALGGVVGAVAGNLWSKHMEDKRKALAQASQGTGVEVTQTADNRLKLNVPSDVSFDTGRADIKPQMRPVLDEIGRNLDPNVRVTIVGHTDSTGSDAINDPLSRDRAMAVRDYLGARGVAPSRVNVSGRGSHEPVASNDTEAGRSANRRVEIFLSETGTSG
ncbi:OmpA family protein [Pelomonas cellulosilytica]|uniref:OmpA family protein n=1 Tax=Pelomonas cellulosilytica TaxID=2906762 RepID=A0ABS8XQK6_9BURK|nr:OmpA family protein [Pelomonas sp. P8]MCE4553126.1 OmpA family protein [Pelomonas sp. P8]